MAYYSDELIEEVRSRNDVVDVISGYVRLQKKGSYVFWTFVRFITKRHRRFRCRRENRCITVLDAEQVEMYLPL